MNELEAAQTPLLGPFGWANWHAHAAGDPELHMLEYVLYSDSSFLGESVDAPGPYRVVNMLSSLGRAGNLEPQLALQVSVHVNPQTSTTPDVNRNTPGSFHGGWIDDELAAIMSVVLNTRIQSGGIWRSFNLFANEDPRGRPQAFFFDPPVLPDPSNEWRKEIIPNAARTEVAIDPISQAIDRYAALSAVRAVAFVRACRQFQRALWVSESDADLSWLFLVSSLESLAAATEFGDDPSPTTLLAATWPEMTDALSQLETDDRETIAELVAPLSKSTLKFITLVERFAPNPPLNRSEGQIDWGQLVPLVKKVYNHRSKALHDGIPMPSPMTEPPFIDDEGRAFECPLGLSTHSYDAHWPAVQMPMLLWTFAHVARGVILNWLAANGEGEISD